jgi:hypothetical protein
MPNRILREGILTSERIAGLGWPAEVFYRRLMSVVDDFGRYWAKPELLRAGCYPLHLDRVGNSDIGKWLDACRKAALVRTYTVAGKEYLELLDFRQQVRAKESKYPAPDTQMPSTCAADAHLDGDVVEDEDVVAELPAQSPDGLHAGKRVNGHEKPKDESPTVIAIPLVGDAEFPVSQSMVAEFEGLYPAVDVPQTLREIRGWNLANPQRRKTVKGALKHVNSWLAREQNKGG